jgi:hypothetical protein
MTRACQAPMAIWTAVLISEQHTLFIIRIDYDSILFASSRAIDVNSFIPNDSSAIHGFRFESSRLKICYEDDVLGKLLRASLGGACPTTP